MIAFEPVEILNARELGQQFRELDRGAQLEIRRGIRSSIGSVTSQMQSEIEGRVTGAPMSGMLQGGVKQKWEYPTVKPSFRPSAGAGRAVAQITAKGRKGFARMFAITELAGSRTDGFTVSGRRMVKVLRQRFPLVKGRGGRFVFKAFLNHRTLMHDAVESALNLYSSKVNMELNRG